jgi:hypothetical protein
MSDELRDAEVAAQEQAGRLLLRYGWPVDADAARHLPATDKQSARNRIMNDAEQQLSAWEGLKGIDELAADQLAAYCRNRRHFDASALARFFVMKHAPEL